MKWRQSAEIPSESDSSAEDVPAVAVEEAHVHVHSRAGPARERLRHERRAVAVQVRELLDRVLERERRVRGGHAERGGVVDLPLRARVLAVRGDDAEAEVLELLDELLDERHVRVPHRVEDVIALEERLLRLAVQEVELRLEAEQGLEPEPPAAVEHPAEDAPRQRPQRLPAVPHRVADEPRRVGRPGNDGRRPRVGDETLVAVGDLLVVERAAHDVGSRVEDACAAVHVETILRIGRGMLDRDQLRAARSVQVGQLEANEADPLVTPLLDDLAGGPLGHGLLRASSGGGRA